MSVRNMGEVGVNLQKIVKRLLNNQNLLKLLYDISSDPLAHADFSDVEKSNIFFNKLIRVVPRVSPNEMEDGRSVICIQVDKGNEVVDNSEYLNLSFSITVLCPFDKWVINDENLRPFSIIGEIQKSLDGKSINGLGNINYDGFQTVMLTDEISGHLMSFTITCFK